MKNTEDALTSFDSGGAENLTRQIQLLRQLEPPFEFSFLFQTLLLVTSTYAAWLIAGWWECLVWCIAYLALQLAEKGIVRLLPARIERHQYFIVLSILFFQASVYCYMPLFLWFSETDFGKFGALALITASTMHSMLNRAAFASILLCFLIPNAMVFVIVAINEAFSNSISNVGTLYLIAGPAIVAFFCVMFWDAHRKEAHGYSVELERKAAQAAVSESERRFRALFENAPIPIREEDLSGMKRLIDAVGIPNQQKFLDFLDANPAFLEACSKQIVVLNANRASMHQHGYNQKSEMVANVVRNLSPAAMKVVKKTALTLHSNLLGNSYETQVTTSVGELRTVAATWSVVPGHEENYSRILLCSLDMTEYREAEAALRQAVKMEAVGQLTGGIAHDFNNLLTVIGGNLDLMEAHGVREPDLFLPIKKSVYRGSQLTQRLLAFSRTQPLSKSEIDLGQLVSNMQDMLSRALGEKIVIETIVKESLWPAIADEGQVEACLLNLAVNARDAMDGTGTIKLSCFNKTVGSNDKDELAPGKYVVLEVSDSGSGMTPEVVARACEPFFTTKDVGKGSGLGLASTYGFAKQSGGDLRIKSELGTGTCVSLFLPAFQSSLSSDEEDVVAPLKRRKELSQTKK